MESFNINEPVQLGFAEIPRKGDFDLKKFPSKIGGLPVWLLPLTNNIDISFFKCSCGNNLSFLLQIYCPLEEEDNSFHRMLYVFFCPICWKKKDLVKVLRINLPEKSTYYNQEEILKYKEITEDKLIKEVNELLSKFILDEFYISTAPEQKEATKLYINFYNNCKEDSQSNSSVKNEEEENSNLNDKQEYDNLVKEYLQKNPGVSIEKVEVESDDEKESDKIVDNSDIILNLFTNVVYYDKKQILRYYRKNFYPLWFTQEKMLTTKDTKCLNCGGDVIFEFQIMPYLLLIEPKIALNDIGTIVIYTCKKCCDSKIEGGFVEEHGFIQRTGENFRDLEDNDNIKNNKKYIEEHPIIEENDFFGGVDEKNCDEDGFVEVKKKKGKKGKKNEEDEDDEK